MQQQGHVLASIAKHAPPMEQLRASCKSLFCVCMVLVSTQFATQIIRTPMPMPLLKSWSCSQSRGHWETSCQAGGYYLQVCDVRDPLPEE